MQSSTPSATLGTLHKSREAHGGESKSQPLPQSPLVTQKPAWVESLRGTRIHTGRGVELQSEGGQLLHAALHWWHQAAWVSQSMDTVKSPGFAETQAWVACCRSFEEQQLALQRGS